MTRTIFATCITACLPLAAFAQAYPTKTVKIVAPVQPGGGVHLVVGGTPNVLVVHPCSASPAKRSRTSGVASDLLVSSLADIGRWTKLARDRKIELAD